MWFIFIGWFLRTAAQASFRQHLLQTLLQGVPARKIMTPNPATVLSHLSLRTLVEERFLRGRFEYYPVVDGDDGGVVGLVTLDQVKEVERSDWDRTLVRDVMTPREEVEVSWQAPMTDVINLMREQDRRVLVTRDGELLGVISAGDISRWVQLEQDLEEVRPVGLPRNQERSPSNPGSGLGG